MRIIANVGDGSEFRCSEPVPQVEVDEVHAALLKCSVSIPKGGTLAHARDAMLGILGKRDRLLPVFARYDKALGRLRSDLRRVERVREAEEAARWDRGEGFHGTTNDRQRAARVRSIIAPILDAQAAIEEDLARVDALLSHARLVLEELRAAHDVASRLLSAADLEWKISVGNR